MDFLRVGLVARPHGINGDVKVIPLTDNVERFYDLGDAYIERGVRHEPVSVSNARIQPDAVLLTLSCSKTRDDAEKLRNLYICVDRDHAVKLPPDTYFVADLIGCAVESPENSVIGRLNDVYGTGANDVYVVILENGKKLQVPALKKLLKYVDTANKRIVFDHDVLQEVGLYED